MTNYLDWQDGNQKPVGATNVPTTLYNGQLEPTGVTWCKNPEYPPNDCNIQLRTTPAQHQSLISNISGFIAKLARFKFKQTGQPEQIDDCGSSGQNLIAYYFDYFMSSVVTKNNLAKELAAIACPAANSTNLPALPIDAVLFYVQKGATPSDPCTLGMTNLNDLTCLLYNKMPQIPIFDVDNIYLGKLWAAQNSFADYEVKDVGGNTIGWGSNTQNCMATKPVNDVAGNTLYWQAA